MSLSFSIGLKIDGFNRISLLMSIPLTIDNETHNQQLDNIIIAIVWLCQIFFITL